MLFSQEMKRDMWVSVVDLDTKPRTYSEPEVYHVNVLPTTVWGDVDSYGSRLSTIERARIDKKYGANIHEYDRVWIFPYGSEPPTFDVLASTATHVVRSVKDTPLVRTVELRRLIPYADEEV